MPAVDRHATSHAARAALAGAWLVCVACGDAPRDAGAGAATGGGSSGGTAESARPPRARPSARGMARAFERVAPDAERCLRAGDPAVTVRGAFAGATGAFAVASVRGAAGASLAYATETCVRVAAERARVRAFREERAEYEHTFAAPAASGGAAVSGGGSGSGSSGGGSSSGGAYVAPTGPPLQDLIDRESGAFQECYAREALARDDRVAGTVEIHLVLDAAGQITRLSTSVQTTHEDPTIMGQVARCVEQRVRAIAFPPQRAPGHEHTFPVHFAPGAAH